MLILKEVFTYDIDKKAIKKLNLSTEQADEFCGGLYKVYNKDYLNFSDDEKYTIYLIEIFNKMKEIIQINENTNILHTKTKLILNILNKINPEKLTINYQSNDLFCLISKIKQNINSYNSINNILKSYFDNPQIFGIAHTLNNLTKVNYKKNFEIDTNIMPYLSLDHFDTLFYYRNKTISSDKLMDTLNGRSCLVFGEGGIGKTVTLRYIMENYINQNNDFETFFFIELANFSNYLKEKDVNDNGLMVYIFDYYLKNEDITYDLFEKLWKDEFSMHFTLLLDGFNEIAESKRNIAEKCISYVKRFENVQIIISDRYYDGIHIDELSHIELKALTIPQVYQYLKTKKINVSNERIELFKILTIPLFLTIYIELKTKNKKENLSQISTKGELLDIFFYPKYSKKNEFYNQYKRYKSIKFYEDISLLFKYVVPYIAYQMVFILDKIEISHLQLKSIINNYFELYNKQEIYINDIDDVHLMDEFYNSYFNKEAQLIYTLRNNLRILIGRKDQENIMVYKFFHQHIRDFFASQYIINDLKYNNNGKNLLINNQLNSIILTYIGEILHEYNTNSYTIGTFLKHKVLDKCTFYTKENDYILSNLLEIWKNAKNNNIIGQFYDLDFSNCQLSGINFHTDNDNSDFYSCTFKEDSFLSDFDGTVLNGAVYHPKINDRIVIASCNGTVQEWNIKTEKIEYIYFGTDNEVENALYRNDGKKILACFGRDVLEFDVGLPKNGYRKFGGNNGIITRAIYNYNNTVILTSSLDGIIREYDYNTGSLLCEYHNNDVEIANNAIYNKTEEYILASYGNGDVVEFLKNNNPEIHIVDEPYYIYKYHKNNGVAYCTYSPDESRIASGGTDYLVKEYTVHRMENDNMNIIEYVGHKDVITGLCYHKKSQQLFSCSADGTIRGWKLTDFNQKKIIVKDAIIYDHHTKAIEDIDIDITKNTVISSSWDRTVKEYTIDNKDNFHEIKVIDELYHSLYSYDGKYVLIYSLSSPKIKVFNINNGKEIKEFSNHFSNFGIKKVVSIKNEYCFIVLTLDNLLFKYNFDLVNELSLKNKIFDFVEQFKYNPDNGILNILSNNYIYNYYCKNNELYNINSHKINYSIIDFMTIDNQFIIIDREGNIFLEKKNESYLLNSFSINKTKKISFYEYRDKKYIVYRDEHSIEIHQFENDMLILKYKKQFENDCLKGINFQNDSIILWTVSGNIVIIKEFYDEQFIKSNLNLKCVLYRKILNELIYLCDDNSINIASIENKHDLNLQKCVLNKNMQINIHSIIFNKNEKNVLSNSSDNQIIEYSIDQMKFNIFENIEYSLNVKNCQFINCNLETKRLEYMLSYYGALLKRKY